MPTEISGSTGVNKIQDNTIVNADINSSAAIAGSKLVMPSGSVLQVVRAESTGSSQSISTTAWTDLTGVTLTITPKSSSSKFLLMGSVHGNANPASFAGFSFRFLRNGTAVHTPTGGHEAYFHDATSDWYARIVKTKLDAPSTSSAITYKIQANNHSTQTITYNYGGDARYASEIVVMEIAG